MRKNKALLWIVCLLVVAMTCAVFVGCQKKGGSFEINNGSGNNGGNSVSIKANTAVTFALDSALSEAEVYNAVQVTTLDAAESKVDVEVRWQGKHYVVYPPVGGYDLGKTYVIRIGEGVRFVDYPDATSVQFAVTKRPEVTLQNGVLEFGAGSVENLKVDGTDADTHSAYGSMTLINNGVALEEGDVFMVKDKDGLSQAYQVRSVVALGATSVYVNWVKPDLGQVMQTMQYSGVSGLGDDGSKAEITYEKDAEEELGKSELSKSIVSIFGKAPQFNVNANIVDKTTVLAEVTITIPDVVVVEGVGSSNLVLKVTNRLTPKADVNFDFSAAALKFNVDALIHNDTECTVSLNANGGYEKVQNVQELVDKLAALDKSNEEGVSVPLFKWMVPIANGAATISYDANLAFRFSFAGSFEVVAKGSVDYRVGVAYNQADGITSYATNLKGENGDFMDEITVEMNGQVQAKVGLIQGLRLEVLAGVLGVGIEAEVGNYNTVYGFATTNNLLAPNASIQGNFFFEGGIYYDIDLDFALKVGSLINLNEGVDIVSGQERLYQAGQEYFALNLNAVEQQVKLGAFVSELPTMTKDVYCMTNGVIERGVAVDVADLKFTTDAPQITVDENGIVTVLDAYRNQAFTAQITVELVNGIGMTSDAAAVYQQTVTVEYTGALVLAKDKIAYNKSADNNTDVTIAVTLAGEAAGKTPVIEGLSEDQYVWTNNALVIRKGALNRMANGEQELVVKAGNAEAKLTVEVTGRLSAMADQVNGVYQLYSADQIVDLAAKSKLMDFAGAAFVLTQDIDMGGIAIEPIQTFAGVLDGKGYAISNYTINSMVGNDAAFIIENKGEIYNLTLAGDVDVTITSKHGNAYRVAGAVVSNLGKVENVTSAGNVKVYSNSLAAFNEFLVASVIADGDGNVTDQAKVAVRFKFDLLNVTFKVRAASSQVTCETVPSYNCTKVESI